MDTQYFSSEFLLHPSIEEFTVIVQEEGKHEYEVYCLNNKVSNGVVKADTTYIRNLYQELSREHRI